MTAGWCSRTLRAAMFAAVCVLLAALGHVLMSGVHVPAWALAAGAAVTGAAGWCLTGRERGPVTVVTVVVAAQTALHTAFEYAQSAAPGRGSSGRGSGDPMAAMSGMHGMSGGAGMGGMGGMDMSRMGHFGHAGQPGHTAPVDFLGAGSSSSGMLAAHLLAALLCGLWLAHGEKAVFRVLRAAAGRLAAPLRLLLALPAPSRRPRVRPRRRRSERAPRLLLVHAITSRGPPLGTAAV
ncbi:hypothetical protein ACFY30_04450 [Streptomyces sp. NPDC000345]|uniref:hypothetical protein n=1 Tax=Streptomyces sp. NPDC000345 TaxID=3364537 RepID=UPI00367DCE38